MEDHPVIPLESRIDIEALSEYAIAAIPVISISQIELSGNQKFLIMVSFWGLAAILILRDGFRAMKHSNKKEPLILFSFGNSSSNPVKGRLFIVLGIIIMCVLTVQLILHFSK